MAGKGRGVRDDKGVSETLGSILVFGIIVSGIAMILLFGTNILNNSKEISNFQNVEQGFKLVQSDIKRVAFEEMPVKLTRIHIDSGTISKDPAKRVTITYAGKDIENHTYVCDYDAQVGEITYQPAGLQSSISIENGGLWKMEGGYDSMITAPRIFMSPDGVLVINVIRLDCEAEKFSGAGTINLYMKHLNSQVQAYDNPPAGNDEVKLEIQTNYPSAWSAAFKDNPVDTTVSDTSDGVEITFKDVKKLIISEHTVRIDPMSISS
ncbi:DUF7289 family protein [Methanocella arvoryzae]|uniref:Uncharacterized protein n=1 Tax=Methanocella arvoryzae (strain DSM 22066 / NBRC 105507 / MRE50) TaxID=351160 RepID=Q0W726_METAR|nr:hypothetical protein [Methanocella arvoryzae]CAJ35817.1 conserved hypothetical protein [Methanocella arvoryzae MRE50]